MISDTHIANYTTLEIRNLNAHWRENSDLTKGFLYVSIQYLCQRLEYLFASISK
jgi:hypothetical protein